MGSTSRVGSRVRGVLLLGAACLLAGTAEDGPVQDLAFFFQAYGPGVAAPNAPADLNGDGFVDDADLSLLLAGI